MDPKTTELSSLILAYLIQNQNRNCSLEEITAGCFKALSPDIFEKNEQEADVLEVLIILSDSGQIILDPLTDQCCIKTGCFN